MAFRPVLLAQAASVALTGCLETAEFGGSGSGGFGGSGGSGSGSFARAQDICKRTLGDQGKMLVSVDSVREYAFSGAVQEVEVRMTVRRDAMTVNTEPRACRFRYATGTADISRT